MISKIESESSKEIVDKASTTVEVKVFVDEAMEVAKSRSSLPSASCQRGLVERQERIGQSSFVRRK